MRLLCVSDTTRSLAFSPSIKSVYHDTDLILSAGDIPLESYDYMSTMLSRDVYYVYGNHNLTHFDREMNKAYYRNSDPLDPSIKFYGFLLDGKIVREKSTGLLIAGLGGSMRYNQGDSQYTEKQMERRILRMIPLLNYNKLRYGRYLDILVTHAPPYGMGDGQDLCHMGFKCFLDFMEKYEPKYLVHGHVHLDDCNLPRVTEYHKTKVINVYGSYLIEDDKLGG
ncbi:MAG: metallophosphoesterase [Spirochaetales bacterium]|nr:metallophosphoesterase [Spirochaetales bacterium]